MAFFDGRQPDSGELFGHPFLGGFKARNSVLMSI